MRLLRGFVFAIFALFIVGGVLLRGGWIDKGLDSKPAAPVSYDEALRQSQARTDEAVAAAHEADGEAQTSETTDWSHGSDGASRNAEEHWHKHGSEFSEFHNAQDYEQGAHDFTAHPPPGTQTKHRSNGDTLFYNPDTNTFAVVNKQGKPRTMFRPDSGRDYWDRQ